MTEPNAELPLRQRIARALLDSSHDGGHGDSVMLSLNVGADAVLAAVQPEVVALTAEVARLRDRVHEAVDETQRRFAPYQARCDKFDVWSKWAREMYERVGGRWGSESEATRLVVQSLIQERDEALAALAQQQALLARAVLVWPQDAMVRIRECIADPSRMGPRQDETVAGWGARAVLKLLEAWRVYSPAGKEKPCLDS